ncbi:MAG TPA: HAD family hydrolase [Myxococcales bacterium]|nr:HAD family hydrolase [Myxococcales bacterium]
MSFSLKAVRGVIFDVDGVLLDARPSYHAAAEEAARRAIAPVVGEEAARAAPFESAVEIAQFKAAGGFNDDWEMSRAIALLLFLRIRGEAPPLAEFLAHAKGRGVEPLYMKYPHLLLDAAQIARTCGALYGGAKCKELFGFEARDAVPDAPEQGLWEKELLLPEPLLLEAVAARFPLALFTGRNPGEARLALVRCALRIPDDLCWVADGRPRKPDPAGLVWLTHKLLKGKPGAQVIFVGDTADDQAAAHSAQDRGAPIVYAHIEQPGDTTRVLSRLLAESGDARA